MQEQSLVNDIGASLQNGKRSRLARAMRVEWLGQMAASVLWIVGMLVNGLNATGDYLQIFAASAWFIANIAALLTAEPD